MHTCGVAQDFFACITASQVLAHDGERHADSEEQATVGVPQGIESSALEIGLGREYAKSGVASRSSLASLASHS
jgi:hypothetical protein